MSQSCWWLFFVGWNTRKLVAHSIDGEKLLFFVSHTQYSIDDTNIAQYIPILPLGWLRVDFSPPFWYILVSSPSRSCVHSMPPRWLNMKQKVIPWNLSTKSSSIAYKPTPHPPKNERFLANLKDPVVFVPLVFRFDRSILEKQKIKNIPIWRLGTIFLQWEGAMIRWWMIPRNFIPQPPGRIRTYITYIPQAPGAKAPINH